MFNSFPLEIVCLIYSFLDFESKAIVCQASKKFLEAKIFLGKDKFKGDKELFVLQRLASKEIWHVADWMTILRLGEEYKRVYKQPFAATDYKLVQFLNRNTASFQIKSGIYIWNLALFPEVKDKY